MTSDSITIWDCPKCVGKLVRRINNLKQTSFLGCSRYPECRYTQKDETLEDHNKPDGVADVATRWE